MGNYEIINHYLNDKKQDSTFSPELLDNLNYEEKIAIECRMAMYCRNGCQQYFKYIPYFSAVKIEETMTPEVLALLSPDDKMEAIKNLFLKTRSSSYLKELTETALESAVAFNNLINLSLDKRLTPEEQEKIKAIVQKVYENKESDINYKIIADYKLSENPEKPKTK